jgi:hypothetical protein
MDQITSFWHNNFLGIIVGAIVTGLLALLWRIAMRTFRFARKFGWRQLLNTGKDVFLHVAASKTIKDDPVLTVAYLTNALASLLLNATYLVIAFVIGFTGLGEPVWLRITAFVSVLFFGYRVGRRALIVNGFYSATAGQAIEELKRSNPLLKKWYGIKDKKPFIEFGEPKPAKQATDTIGSVALPIPPESAAHNDLSDTPPEQT